MNEWHEHFLWLIESKKEDIKNLRKWIKEQPSDLATIPEPWASMTAEEIKESMGVYK